ncbi:hypothetical protein LZ009_03660 [Ramlibacter sp. XY19]|uniref:hypothetical protein n=1 Tax=Ramlibacter paludis TaxID=2908000 RepID=UPI0023DC12CE|nr:hypothetical protein [Ramlibacter paludis]MCG2591868.1 hypothetical protein [Ramlibacter paludis]
MKRLMKWAGSQGNWAQSEFGGLPAVQREAVPLLQRWQVVAGGLALVLSRASRTEREARFHASNRLYQGLRRRLRQGAAIDASTELIQDVMHEIAGVADVQTTQCLRACFDASLGRDGIDSALGLRQERDTSRLNSQPRPSDWQDTQQQRRA